MPRKGRASNDKYGDRKEKEFVKKFNRTMPGTVSFQVPGKGPTDIITLDKKTGAPVQIAQVKASRAASKSNNPISRKEETNFAILGQALGVPAVVAQAKGGMSVTRPARVKK